jgi:hypothetical protein
MGGRRRGNKESRKCCIEIPHNGTAIAHQTSGKQLGSDFGTKALAVVVAGSPPATAVCAFLTASFQGIDHVCA